MMKTFLFAIFFSTFFQTVFSNPITKKDLIELENSDISSKQSTLSILSFQNEDSNPIENDEEEGWSPERLVEEYNISKTGDKYFFIDTTLSSPNITEDLEDYFKESNFSIYIFIVDKLKTNVTLTDFMENYVELLNETFDPSFSFLGLYVKESGVSVYSGNNLSSTISQNDFKTIITKSLIYFNQGDNSTGYEYILHNVIYKTDFPSTLTTSDIAKLLKMDMTLLDTADYLLIDTAQKTDPESIDKIKKQFFSYFAEKEIYIFYFLVDRIDGENQSDFLNEAAEEIYEILPEEIVNNTIILLSVNYNYEALSYKCGENIPNHLLSSIYKISKATYRYGYRNPSFGVRYMLRNLRIQLNQMYNYTLEDFISDFEFIESEPYYFMDDTLLNEEETANEFLEKMKLLYNYNISVYYIAIHNEATPYLLDEFMNTYNFTKDKNNLVFIKLNEYEEDDQLKISSEVYAGENLNLYLDEYRIFYINYNILSAKIQPTSNIRNYVYDNATNFLVDTVYTFLKVINEGWSFDDIETIMSGLYGKPDAKAMFANNDLSYKELAQLVAVNEIISYGTNLKNSLFIFALNKIEDSETVENITNEIKENFDSITNSDFANSIIITIDLENEEPDISIVYGDEIVALNETKVEELIAKAKTYSTRYEMYKFLVDEMRENTVGYWNTDSLYYYYLANVVGGSSFVIPSYFLDPHAYAYDTYSVTVELASYLAELYYYNYIYFEFMVIDKTDGNETESEIATSLKNRIFIYGTNGYEIVGVYINSTDTLSLYVGENLKLPQEYTKHLIDNAKENYFSKDKYIEGYDYFIEHIRNYLIYLNSTELAMSLHDALKDSNSSNYLFYEPCDILDTEDKESLTDSILKEFPEKRNISIYYAFLNNINIDNTTEIEQFFSEFTEAFRAYDDVEPNSIIALFILDREEFLINATDELENNHNFKDVEDYISEKILAHLKENNTFEAAEEFATQIYLRILKSELISDYLISVFEEEDLNSQPIVDLYMILNDTIKEELNEMFMKYKKYGVYLFAITTNIVHSSESNLLEEFYNKVNDTKATVFTKENTVFLLYKDNSKSFEIYAGSEYASYLTATILSEIKTTLAQMIQEGNSLATTLEKYTEIIEPYEKLIINWTADLLTEYAKDTEEYNDVILFPIDLNETEIELYKSSFKTIFGTLTYILEINKFTGESTFKEFFESFKEKFVNETKIDEESATFILILRSQNTLLVYQGDSMDEIFRYTTTAIQSVISKLLENEEYSKVYSQLIEYSTALTDKNWWPEALAEYLDRKDYCNSPLFSEIGEPIKDEDVAKDYKISQNNFKSLNYTYSIIILNKIKLSSNSQNINEFLNDTLTWWKEYNTSFTYDIVVLIKDEDTKEISLNEDKSLESKLSESVVNQIITNAAQYLNNLESPNNYQVALPYVIGKLIYYLVYEDNYLTPSDYANFYKDAEFSTFNYHIFDLLAFIDYEKRLELYTQMEEIYNNKVNIYIFLTEKMETNKTENNYMDELSNLFTTTTTTSNTYENSILIFVSKNEKKFIIKSIFNSSNYITDNAISYIMDTIYLSSYEYEDIMSQSLSYINKYVSLNQKIDYLELSNLIKEKYPSGEPGYGLYDLFINMPYSKVSELLTNNFVPMYNNETSVYMFLVKDANNDVFNINEYLDKLITELNFDNLNNIQKNKIYILYTWSTNKFGFIPKADYSNKFTEAKILNISEDFINAFIAQEYDNAFDTLFDKVNSIINQKDDDDDGNDNNTAVIIIFSVIGVIVLFIIIFIIYRICRRKINTKKIEDKFIASAAKPLNKDQDDAQTYDF